MYRGVGLLLAVLLVPFAGAASAAGKNEDLLRAAWEGRIEDVQKLIADGVDVNAANGQGRTALMGASYFGNEYVVKMLLAAGADVNVKDKQGATALINGAFSGKEEVVRALIAGGADVNAKTSNGISAAKKLRKVLWSM